MLEDCRLSSKKNIRRKTKKSPCVASEFKRNFQSLKNVLKTWRRTKVEHLNKLWDIIYLLLFYGKTSRNTSDSQHETPRFHSWVLQTMIGNCFLCWKLFRLDRSSSEIFVAVILIRIRCLLVKLPMKILYRSYFVAATIFYGKDSKQLYFCSITTMKTRLTAVRDFSSVCRALHQSRKHWTCE